MIYVFICIERFFDDQPLMCNNFLLRKKNLIDGCNSHLYASFELFWTQIGQSFEAKWVFEICLQVEKSLLEGKCPRLRKSSDCLKCHSAAKNCPIWTQDMPREVKEVDYKFIKDFIQKYFVVYEQSAVKNSLITYVCYDPDGLFLLQVYGVKLRLFFSPFSFFLSSTSSSNRINSKNKQCKQLTHY